MADTYTNTLGVILMGIGSDNNTWGTNLNNSVFQIFEDAIANALPNSVTGGTLDLSGSPPPAGPSAARYAFLPFAGTLTANQIVKVPNLTKSWLVKNGTSGAFTLSMQTPSGAPVAIPQNGGWQLVYCDGNNNIVVWPFNTAQIEMPNGSAAAPAFSFLGETGSGWYRNGTQDIRLAINGSDVLQVTGTGAGTPNVMNLLAGALQVGGVQVIPSGAEQAYAGINLPAGWLWEDGSAYSRTTFANLFAALTATVTGNTHSSTAIDGLSADLRGKGLNGAVVEGTGIPTGTTITFTGASTATLSAAATSSNSGIALRILPYGQGDAATTFNVPDRRGRALFGRDDMNGTAAGRITVNAGTHLNTAGGEETHTLVTGEMPSHNHGITEPNSGLGHSHASHDGTAPGGAYVSDVQGINKVQAGNSSNNLFLANNPIDMVNIPTSKSVTGISINNAGGGGAHNTMPVFGISNMIIKT
jgi:microcystin-dependent protein